MSSSSTQPNFKAHFSELLNVAARQLSLSDTSIRVEMTRTKQASHGDYSCNLAMQLAKPLRKNPREIAQSLIDALPESPYLEKVDIAGAGFINLFVKASFKKAFTQYILQQGEEYGHNTLGQQRQVQVEFVSANPTGPLHVGHGRGAALGASLANILSASGFSVVREYYVNDAGRQMDILALSTWLRYLAINDVEIPFPANAYQGDYVRHMAQAIHDEKGREYVCSADALLQGLPESCATIAVENDEQLDYLIVRAKELLANEYSFIHQFVLTAQLADCRGDLIEFGVEFDSWFSERSLFAEGHVERVITLLKQKKFLYQKEGAVWFRSTDFGDEKDRVVQRENGQFTYFASDIAYHLNKFERGAEQVINIWGADHHGYIARVKGALQALEQDAEKLNIALVQFAVLYRDGKKAPMSTRSGEFVTLRELREEVGKDAARFFYVMRKSDQHLDFDLDLAKSQSNDNPVYYVQYAHARICSVLAQWDGDVASLSDVCTESLVDPVELMLLQKLIDFPDVIEAAAREFAPHLVAFYLRELAGEFHSYYNATRFLVPDEAVQYARLALVASIQQVLCNGLGLLGVNAPEKM